MKYDVAVIGGGPAGMMAAGRAAERGLSVILLEKNDSLGKKLLITGGGRCNVTNAEFNNRTLLAKFKDSDKFLFSAFSQHSVAETLKFFHSHNMPTKVEAEKRVFPVSDSAKSVWEVMIKYLREGNVTVQSNTEITGFIQTKPCRIDAVKFKDCSSVKTKRSIREQKTENIIEAHSFILATGGKSHPETGSTGDGFNWLAKMGHTITPPQVSLVPVKVEDNWVKKLSGFSLVNVKITLFQNSVKQSTEKFGKLNSKIINTRGKNTVNRGKILFTHFGLSGPAILNISSEIGELLKYDEVVLSLDLLPSHDYSTLNSTLQKLFADNSNKMLKNALGSLIPNTLVSVVIEKSGIKPETFCNSVTREQRIKLGNVLKDIRVRPTGLLNVDKAIVTSGGVALTEIDWRTMNSRLINNLHIVGDLLDINRPSGGYSLQLCWTTGWVAGNSINMC